MQELYSHEGNECKPEEIELKESSIDDNPDDKLVSTPVHTPVPHGNDCVIIDNHVAIETQEDTNRDVSHNNDEDDSVIKNQQFEGSHSSNSVHDIQAARRDILFPMRDQKSLEEIKQVIH